MEMNHSEEAQTERIENPLQPLPARGRNPSARARPFSAASAVKVLGSPALPPVSCRSPRGWPADHEVCDGHVEVLVQAEHKQGPR